MITDQGQAKVLDFGVATLTPQLSSGLEETRARDVVITGAGMVVGTVAYMSPEQAEGKDVDARSDIFSFGSILYEMLSGQRASELTPLQERWRRYQGRASTPRENHDRTAGSA